MHLAESRFAGLAEGPRKMQAGFTPPYVVQDVEQKASTVKPGHKMRDDASVVEPEKDLTQGSSALFGGTVPMVRGMVLKGPFYRALDPKDHLGRRTW